jgi:hypothetical protein
VGEAIMQEAARHRHDLIIMMPFALVLVAADEGRKALARCLRAS